ncbi:hypothetical protein ACS0TY_019654 [Phlomoides rotata]
MSYGFMRSHKKSKRCRLVDRNYSIKTKVPGQMEKLHFLAGYHDETCRDHIRMNTDCFNRLCYLLRNLGGLRDTRNVTISEQVTIFLIVLSHHTKNHVIKYSFNRSGYTIIVNVLIVTPEPIPEDNNDYRWKYFKGCLGTLDDTYIHVREGSAADNRILCDAVTRPNGLRVPNVCYYLCDGGYTNCNDFLAPYKGVRYHLKEWDESR